MGGAADTRRSDSFSDLLEANAAYATAFRHRGVEARPAKQLAVVTCMDSRIDPLAMLGLRLGDAKVLRNAGARVTDDVVRSLALAATALGVERVMIVAHTDCRAIGDDERPEALRRDVEQLRSEPELAGLSAGGFLYDVDTGRVSRFC